MAQVKYLKNGEKNASKDTEQQQAAVPQEGVFRKNGRTLTGQLAIDRLEELAAKQSGDEREGFSIVKRAIQDGNIVDYDSDRNEITITDKDGNDVFSKYSDINASYDDSGFKRNMDATLNNRRHRFKKSLYNLARVNMELPDNRAALNRGSGWFSYKKDASGNTIYDDNKVATYIEGPENLDKTEIVKAALQYGWGSDEDRAKLSTKNYSDEDIRKIIQYSQSISEGDREQYLTDFLNRIKLGEKAEGGISQADLEFLKLVGLTPNGITAAAGTATAPIDETADINSDKYIDPTYGDDGIRENLKNRGIGVRKDSEGRWQFTGDNDFTKANWYTGDLDFIANGYDRGFILNGKLYSENEAYNDNRIKSLVDNWYGADSLRSDWEAYYDALNNSGIRFAGDRTWNNNPEQGSANYYGEFTQYLDPTAGYHRGLSPYFKKQGVTGKVRVANASNLFDGLDADTEIFAYLDPTTSMNGRGVPVPHFVRYNKRTGEITSDTSGLTRRRFVGIAPQQISISNWTPIGNREYATYAEFGEEGRKNTIYVDRDGNFYLARRQPNGSLSKPEQIYNLEFLQELLNNPSAYTNNQIWTNLRKRGGSKQSGSTNYGKVTTGSHTVDLDTLARAYGVRREKSGGELPKFVTGGGMSKVTTNKNDIKTEEAGADISKAHALDGSDGGLTNIEKLQIASAVGDLAGVGLSFIEGVGKFGAAGTGAAASTTRFIADIKQDGFQGRDLGNYAMNLLLDSATILPILGTGVKAAKAARVIKSCAKPILKLLSISGAAAPVVTAVQRIANGEKYTSRDLAQAIQGIGSAAIATKLIKDAVGNAKVASRLSKAVAQSKNAGSELNGITKTFDEISGAINGKTKTQAIKAIQDLFKVDGKSISTKQAQEFLENLPGASFVKGEFIKKGVGNRIASVFNPKLRKRTSAKVEFETPEFSGRSALYYYLNPFGRSKMLGSEAVFGFGKQKGELGRIGTSEMRGAQRRVFERGWRASNIDKALNRLAVETPKSFQNMFVDLNGNPVQVRSEAANVFGGYRRNRPVVVRPRLTMEGVMAENKNVPVHQFESFGELFTPREIIRFAPREALFERALRNGWTPKLPSLQQLVGNPYPGIIVRKNGGKILKAKKGSGGITGEGYNINYANLDDTLRAFVTSNALRNIGSLKKEANNILMQRAFQAPKKSQVGYNFSDIRSTYQSAKEPILTSQFQTNSLEAALAHNLAKGEQLSDLNRSENAEISNRKASVDQYNIGVSDYNNAAETEVANNRSDWLTQLRAQNKLQDAATKDAQWSQVWNTFGQQMSQQARTAYNNKLATAKAFEKSELDKREKLRIKSALIDKGYQAQWNALSESDKARYGDIEQFVYSKDKNAYEDIYTPDEMYVDALRKLTNKYASASGAGIFYQKSGGSIRPAQEQIAINGDKAAKRGTAKFSDNLMKMLQQLLKKY